MAKNTINVVAETVNPWNRSALTIAMEKIQKMEQAEKATQPDPDLLAKFEALEREYLLMKAVLHYDKVDRGLVPGVEPVIPITQPEPEPIYKTHRGPAYIPILGQQKKAKQHTVKAETAQMDEFEPVTEPVKTYKKATAVKADTQPAAGKAAFTQTFRDAVMEAFKAIKPGQEIEAHTVNAEDPTSKKYRVYFDVAHMGSTIVLNRKSKKPFKAFTVEIPLTNGKLNPAMIPAYAPKK